jgi:hypothetical protein
MDGSAGFGVYRTTINWVIADAPWDTSKVSNPDLELTVNALPARLKSPSLVRAMFSVDQQGHPSSCVAEPAPSLEHAENDPALVPVACEQLMKSYTAVPAKDETGKLVPSIQDALVRFSIDPR